MCGLFGFYTKKPLEQAARRARIVKLGLINSMVRGYDATGIAYGTMDEKEQVSVVKQAMPADLFTNYSGYERAMNNCSRMRWLVGHTRSATGGRNAEATREAHPFSTDHITLAHNGFIQNSHALAAHIPGIDVDSSKVAASMVINGESETLVMLEGAYALTWHNAEDNTLNFAKNDARPLYLVHVNEEDTVYWASCREMLHWLFRAHGLTEKGLYMKYKTHHHLKLDVVTGKTTVKAFTPNPDSAPHTAKALKDAAEREKNRNPILPAGANATPIGGMIRNLGPVKATELARALANVDTDGKTIRETAMELKIGSIDGLIYAPKHPHKLRMLCGMLESIGLRMNQVVQLSTDMWAPYDPVKAGRLGAVKGTLHRPLEPLAMNPYVLGVCPNITREVFSKCANEGGMIGRVANLHDDPLARKPRVVVEFDAILHNTMLRPKNNQSLVVVGRGRDEDENACLEMLRGPGGQYISVNEWDRLCKEGCASCTGDLFQQGAEFIAWQGSAPICPTCQSKGVSGVG